LAAKPEVSNPKSLQGHSLNLKKWMQEIGIPPWRRQAQPLLTMSKADTDVVIAPIDQQLYSDWVSIETPY
jgi:tRNA(Ile)-lysidine synthetase-like protein